MDIPNAKSHFEISKRGYLQKLSSRSFPYIPHPWKRKFCILTKGHLYYYEKDNSKGADKGSGVINLEYYDQVVEAPSKECKKATNVLVLTSHDRSFFDPGRHLFSCDSQQEMLDWIRLLKSAIQQIRNNHRTIAPAAATGASAQGSHSNPSTPRQSGCPASKSELGELKSGASGTGQLETANKDKPRRLEEEDGADKGRKKRGEEGKAGGENKENVEDWSNSKDRKQEYSESSLRRRRANPSSRSMDESALEVGDQRIFGTNSFGRKKPEGNSETNSTHSSLGRKQGNRGKPNQGRPASSGGQKSGGKTGASLDFKTSGKQSVDMDQDKVLGSLGRKSKNEKSSPNKGSSGDSGCSGSGASESTTERRKRKADDEEVDVDVVQEPECGQQLQSVTKHRVKGPPGRRKPQTRRSQQLMMKHRASSLSALAHNAELHLSQDTQPASFVPWLNRSLDLLGEEMELHPTRNSQPAMGYIFSDHEELEDPEEQLYEYNVDFNDQNCTFDDNGGLFVQDGQFVQQQPSDGYNVNLSSGMLPPPLPPRMESRLEFTPGVQNSIQMQNQFQLQQHQQLQQQLHQMQYQATLQQQQQQHQQNQICSPFGTAQTDAISDREMKKQHRRSQPIDEMGGDLLMTRSMTNELFIASYSDDNSCDASNPQLHHPQPQQQQQQQKQRQQFGSAATHENGAMGPSQQKQPRPKNGARPNGQKNKKTMSQPDVNRFTVAVRNLQKHVVELDQAVNEITKEVEDSKTDLGNIKSSLVTIKKDKDRLNDAVSIVSQEAVKMREQIVTAQKEAEKLQRTATAALVVAEKAKVDQLHLKKEYEGMLKDLKNVIDNAKRDATQNSTSTQKRVELENEDIEDESEDEERSEMEEEKKESKKREKSGGYQSFFSRPSSIISGLTNRASMGKSATSVDSLEKEKERDPSESPKKNRDKSSKERLSRADSKSSEKKGKKDKQINKSGRGALSPEREKSRKVPRNLSEDFPMMDETNSPRALSPVGSDPDIVSEDSSNLNNNYNLGKSISSPTVPTRPRALNLKPQTSDLPSKTTSAASSPDSPTRPSSPFDVTRLHLNGRSSSPTGFALHRPGSTPGPLNRQGSMSTVPEDRAVDTRMLDNRPSDPPPPPPTSRGVYAISRQNSSPNIATQKSSPLVLQRQHSLGVVLEDKSSISRQSSVVSVNDERLIVDKTLPLSPTSSMMSFPGSWSTTSLNRPESNVSNGDGDVLEVLQKTLSKNRTKGPLEQVAGSILSGSGLQTGVICPLDEIGADPPLATSSLKKRKKVKKDPVQI